MSDIKKVVFSTEQKKPVKSVIKNKALEIVFVCAVDCEYKRFLEYLYDNGIVFVEDNDTQLSGFSRKLFLLDDGVEQHLCLVVKQKADGMVPCAFLCAKIMEYKPKLVVMCGICGGVPKKVKRGDLVIVDKTYDYGAGKYTEDGTFRPKYAHIKLGNNRLEEACINASDMLDELKDRINQDIYDLPLMNGGYKKAGKDDIVAHMGMMVTGAAVVNCKSIIDDITHRQRDVIAYDMEAYALAYMCDGDNVPWLVVKGVQDLADTPDSEKDEYNRLAAYLSAAFVIEAVKKYMGKI